MSNAITVTDYRKITQWVLWQNRTAPHTSTPAHRVGLVPFQIRSPNPGRAILRNFANPSRRSTVSAEPYAPINPTDAGRSARSTSKPMAKLPKRRLPVRLPRKCPPRGIGRSTPAVRYFETNPMRRPKRSAHMAPNSCWWPMSLMICETTPWGTPTASTFDAMHDRTGTQYAAKVRSKTNPMGGWLLGWIWNLATKVHAKVSASLVSGSVSAQTRVVEAEIIELGAQADAMVIAAMVAGKVSPLTIVRDGLVSKAVVSNAVSSKTALRRRGSRSGDRLPKGATGVICKTNPMRWPGSRSGEISGRPIGCIDGHRAIFRNKPHGGRRNGFPILTP